MNRVTKMLAVTAVAAAVAVLATACGGKGDSGNSGGESASAKTEAAAQAAEPAGFTTGDDAAALASATDGGPAVLGQGTGTIDEFINDYERFMDSYIDVLKKLKAGDLSGAADIQRLSEEMKGWNAPLQELQTKGLTAEQRTRFQTLQTRYTNELKGL